MSPRAHFAEIVESIFSSRRKMFAETCSDWVAIGDVPDASTEKARTPIISFNFLTRGNMNANLPAQEKAVTWRSQPCEMVPGGAKQSLWSYRVEHARFSRRTMPIVLKCGVPSSCLIGPEATFCSSGPVQSARGLHFPRRDVEEYAPRSHGPSG